MKNTDADKMTARLTGALIGVARSTEGNANKPTMATHKAMLSGMRLALPGTDASEQQIGDCVELLHREKEKLIPHCSNCDKPCGRNNDFDPCEINEPDAELGSAKRTLLSGILSLEPLLRHCPENELFERAMDFIYGGLFYVGYDCEIGSILPIIGELEEITGLLAKDRV